MIDLIKSARVETFDELRADFYKVAGEAMIRHGDDPGAADILAAALADFITTADREVAPGLARLVVAMLKA